MEEKIGLVIVVVLRPQTPKHITGGWSHYTDTSEPVDGGVRPYNSEPPEQSCLLRWTEKIASICFGPLEWGPNPIPSDPRERDETRRKQLCPITLNILLCR
jgi:hypothetical protein